ncbi:PREDICTED: ubiquitin-conjugating enzyme E2 J2-like [Bactrocera latifrons]|uniref:Ubiquitin-conjugating enzyme E2 J2 n=1 Tax=Bactrocera latifrons TaxID=174628 RepID=A0A0K8W053_BACLA|nr:PREDICTED: ubiquitin-conjugating enzyme E2 J2-like [Bactrocera latifrons]XP_018801314.1 PREDICTED: ubiquitin-conjugating enzyme E2 J2-like [Bactrocera latifrons]XP_018801315.1 PREDICTED: ubiquitin-conjugating enzyme E2 J2-like [Bactrocera latifrons]XP_018801316.1 PREDICTED: ubiquitin-conjugating enzyme E2 J2-like [Bactrocera latifrons]XP_018801318.1 PREDICTED: ubiquitin-conjugating enzyme E2 J2-like [Bactrocera latifrons]XP_018801319.1 PREDICTED: ubiquitin-conjugating enzyme E2 J2-like [Bac
MASTKPRKQPTAISRMRQDYMRLKRDPLPYITAEPLPNNILEWHYVVKGPVNTPYYGGYYHGTLLFPREFPFKPPSIYMLTPNGRFKTNTRLCLSISDFHPDTWNPTWCVGTILTGLLSFMLESTPTLGSIETTTYEKKSYARKSLEYNLKDPIFRELFPEVCEEINKLLEDEKQKLALLNGELNRKSVNNVIPATNNENSSNGAQLVKSDECENKRKSIINWPGLYSNLVIGISFSIFALVVNYVIKNLNQE